MTTTTEIPITPVESPEGWRMNDPSFIEGLTCECFSCDRSPSGKMADGFFVAPGYVSRRHVASECAAKLMPTFVEPVAFERGRRHTAHGEHVIRYIKRPPPETAAEIFDRIKGRSRDRALGNIR